MKTESYSDFNPLRDGKAIVAHAIRMGWAKRAAPAPLLPRLTADVCKKRARRVMSCVGHSMSNPPKTV